MFKAVVPDPTDEGVILVRGVPFGGPGDRDVHGQYFSPNTNFLSHILPLPPLFHFHGAKSGSLADQIGETVAREQRSDGIWYRARLYLDSGVDAVRQKAVQLWESAKAGRLFASSGAVEATIKIAEGGEILQWLVGELSLIDTRNNRENPASFHATVVPVKGNLDGVDTGEVTVESLSISTKQKGEDDEDYSDKRDLATYLDEFIYGMRRFFPDDEDAMREAMESMFRRVFTAGTSNISTRSADMPDENQNQADVLAQMQQQMLTMQQQMNALSEQNTTLQSDVQARDGQIAELQGIVTTKSAEVAMGAHIALVDGWIADGKITPAERDAVLDLLLEAYKSDTSTKSTKSGGTFVNAIKGWVDARPVNPIIGSPSTVYSNLNGGVVEGPGGGVDPANIARLKRYAEITE